jgi:hypothetical protein
MKTRTAPWDYQSRRFSLRDNAKELSGYFDAKAGRLPRNFDEYPIELRLAWFSVRDAYACLNSHSDAKRAVIREIHNTINILSARFNVIFDCYWAGLFNEPPEYYAELEAMDWTDQHYSERPN